MNTDAAPTTIRALGADEWQPYRDLRLRSLAESPAAFCSTLAEEQLRDAGNWSARVAAAAASGRDCPLVAERKGMLLGLLWAKFDAADKRLVHLFQMWVAPEARGTGVAAGLLDQALAWAAANGAHAVELGVFASASAAVRLYRRAGFEDLCAAPEGQSQTMRLLLQPRDAADAHRTA